MIDCQTESTPSGKSEPVEPLDTTPLNKPTLLPKNKWLRRAPAPHLPGAILEGLTLGLPGFKKFRRQGRLQRAALKIEEQATLIVKAMFHLQAFFALLGEWAAEDNWLLRETHAEKCDLNNKLVILQKCSCTPVRERIWNGNEEHFAATHKALGFFEHQVMGASEPVSKNTDQPIPASPDVPECLSKSDA